MPRAFRRRRRAADILVLMSSAARSLFNMYNYISLFVWTLCVTSISLTVPNQRIRFYHGKAEYGVTEVGECDRKQHSFSYRRRRRRTTYLKLFIKMRSYTTCKILCSRKPILINPYQTSLSGSVVPVIGDNIYLPKYTSVYCDDK